MVATVAGIPILSRLKSMMRSLRLCPPPIKRMVVSPELRRPPVRGLGSSSGLCGLGRGDVVIDQRGAVTQRLGRRSVSLNWHKSSQLSALSSQL